MKNEKTKVQFLIDADNEVFAFFPDEYYNIDLDADLRTCYCHIGQHSACSYEYARDCKLAEISQYIDLYKELESIGYNLDIELPF